MEAYFERLIERAATIDELLSDDFEALPGRKGDTDLAARRLAAWCRSCANGDWALFGRRLERDGWSFAQVLARFATVRRKASAPAARLDRRRRLDRSRAAKRDPHGDRRGVPGRSPSRSSTCCFRWWSMPNRCFGPISALAASDHFAESARASLRRMLLNGADRSLRRAALRAICQGPRGRNRAGCAPAGSNSGTSRYRRFVADMKAGGFRSLFEEKPVLLRLIATLTRQWIDSCREFACRLDVDLETLRRDVLHSGAPARVASIDGRSFRSSQWRTLGADRHLRGRRADRLQAQGSAARCGLARPDRAAERVSAAARIARGSRDRSRELRLDRIHRSHRMRRSGRVRNGSSAGPAPGSPCFIALSRPTCTRRTSSQRATTRCRSILRPSFSTSAAGPKAQDAEAAAFDAAADIIANSVMRVGLLPAYGRGPGQFRLCHGRADLGLEFQDPARLDRHQHRRDAARRRKRLSAIPIRICRMSAAVMRSSAIISTPSSRASRIMRISWRIERKAHGIAGRICLTVSPACPCARWCAPRDSIRCCCCGSKITGSWMTARCGRRKPISLRDCRIGTASADANWPFLRAERAALVTLNVPHFVLPSDGNEIRDAAGIGAGRRRLPGWTARAPACGASTRRKSPGNPR